jgi:hypothetical protein
MTRILRMRCENTRRRGGVKKQTRRRGGGGEKHRARGVELRRLLQWQKRALGQEEIAGQR